VLVHLPPFGIEWLEDDVGVLATRVDLDDDAPIAHRLTEQLGLHAVVGTPIAGVLDGTGGSAGGPPPLLTWLPHELNDPKGRALELLPLEASHRDGQLLALALVADDVVVFDQVLLARDGPQVDVTDIIPVDRRSIMPVRASVGQQGQRDAAQTSKQIHCSRSLCVVGVSVFWNKLK